MAAVETFDLGAALGRLMQRPEAGAFLGMAAVFVIFGMLAGAGFLSPASFASWLNIASEVGNWSSWIIGVAPLIAVAMNEAFSQTGAELPPQLKQQRRKNMADDTPVPEPRKVDKSFGPIDVLHEISPTVRAEEALRLFGDIRAGKSTLIKTPAGDYKPTRGQIVMDGKEIAFSGPNGAADRGIATVH